MPSMVVHIIKHLLIIKPRLMGPKGALEHQFQANEKYPVSENKVETNEMTLWVKSPSANSDDLSSFPVDPHGKSKEPVPICCPVIFT